MKAGERILLVFMTLVLIAILLLIGVSVWNGAVRSNLFSVFDGTYGIYIKIGVTVCLVFLAVLSVRASLAGINNNAARAAKVATTQDGGIYINLDTISSLAEKAVRKVNGVSQLCVRTGLSDGGAVIAVKVAFSPDTVIPQASAEIQQAVKQNIENLCGIAVTNVSVQVDNSLQK